jgi:nickel transport protein
MRRFPLLVLLGAAGLALTPLAGRAHGIETEVHVHGSAGTAQLQASLAGTLDLQSVFSNGEPARDAAVRLMPAGGGTPIELGRTDAQGRLAFALPARTGKGAEIQVDAGPGHRDWIELSELTGGRLQATGQPLAWRTGLLTLAPVAALGLLGGLALLYRPRG